jgi:predicted phage terminase large subunit-like protein
MLPQFELSWHHDILLKELQAWAVGDTQKLMLFLPPRYAKSLFGSRVLPPFIHGLDPNARIMTASYASELAEEHARAAQNYVLSAEYAELFPNTSLAPSAPTAKGKKPRLRSDMYDVAGHRGYYRAAGRSGSFTGHGLTHGIIDDPFKNREEAESATIRDKVWNWYTSAFLTRRDVKDASMLLIMTRWHEDDLAGRLLKGGSEWKVVRMPAIMEAQDLEYAHAEDLRDEGEALWPTQFDLEALQEIRAEVGEYDWNALFQQRPVPSGGAKIPVGKMQYIDEDELPKDIRWIRFWDIAVSKKTSADFTAGGLLGRAPGQRGLYLKDMIRGRWEWPDTRRLILETAARERVPTGIETSAQQQGFFDDLKRQSVFASVPLFGAKPDKDKLTRALTWIAVADEEQFYLVRGGWTGPFVSEAAVFTGVDDVHDDQIDSVSGAYELLVTTYSNLTELMVRNARTLLRT